MAFDISKFAQTLEPQEHFVQVSDRSLEIIGAEVRSLTQQARFMNVFYGVEIGRRFVEAKSKTDHGAWCKWLETETEYSLRSANRFMQLFKESDGQGGILGFSPNSPTLANLSISNVLRLLALPEEEREDFAVEVGADRLSARELDKVIRERDEARKAEAQARAEAEAAGESRAKMETDMAALKALHEAKIAETEEQARALDRLQAELQELRERPVDVAVMEVDQEALEAARREAVAEVQAKLEKAVEGRKKAEERRKTLETEMEALQKKLAAADAEQKKAALAGDKDFAAFELMFAQAQENINRLHGLLLKFRGRSDPEMAERLQKALLALADMTRRATE